MTAHPSARTRTTLAAVLLAMLLLGCASAPEGDGAEVTVVRFGELLEANKRWGRGP